MVQEIPEAMLQAHIGQKIILEREGMVLMCRHPQFEKWDFPGGRLHTGESPLEGLVREVKEEIGVDITVHNPLYISLEPMTKPQRYYVLFAATLVDSSAEFVLDADEIAELRWVGPTDVDTLVTWDDWRTILTRHFTKHGAS
jgi:8-oxo-dGTP pyrophosphatase MutT (NUDIX family)